MICPNCRQAELEIYNYENHSVETNKLMQDQWLWCPCCQYHSQQRVTFKELHRKIIWEEKEE